MMGSFYLAMGPWPQFLSNRKAGHVEILGCRTLSLKGSTAAEPEGKPSRAKHAIEKGENKMDGDPGIGGKDWAFLWSWNRSEHGQTSLLDVG